MSTAPPSPSSTTATAGPAARPAARPAAPAGRAPVPAPRVAVTATRDAGMATAEYAIATLAACGFAGLLLAILAGDQVRGLLLGIVQRALGSV
jgi:hypothetical protein